MGMRRNLALILILTLIISIIPINSYASDGTHLFYDVRDALGSTRGILYGSDMQIEPSIPAYAASVGTEIMHAERINIDVRDEFGDPVLDEYGNIKQKSIVNFLRAATKTTYANPTSTTRYKAVAYTFLLVDPHDHSKVLYSARVTGDIENVFDATAKNTKAYKDGYRVLYSTKTIPSEVLVSRVNNKAASNS